MATYRTIRMDFWNDPYVEGMEPQDKLLYVYLFSSPTPTTSASSPCPGARSPLKRD